MRNLNDLDTSILPFRKIQSLEDLLCRLAPAECAIASLVEAFYEGNVEASHGIAQSHVDVGVRPWMREGG